MNKHCIINGPNLNLLGMRETHIYGKLTLSEIKDYTNKKCAGLDVKLDWFQAQSEEQIINLIQKIDSENYKSLIINPAAYSHTSIAILDALRIVKVPVVEVHLTNIFARETYRQEMLTAQACSVIMSGLGKDSYYLAIVSQENKN